MTYPPQPPQGSEPPYGSEPPHGSGPQQPYGDSAPLPPPPPYGQPGAGQPPYGQPPYGQPTPGQPPYGQPPYGQAPPKKKSNATMIGLIIGGSLLALCLVCSLIGAIVYASSDSSDPVSDYSYSPPALTSGAPDSGSTDEPATGSEGSLNKPARDGDAEFTVKSVECGITEVGQYAKYRPKGQYCQVKATVKNVGSGEVSLVTASRNEATTDAGNTVDADITATIASNPDDSSKFLSDVAPGGSEDLIWAWDIPTGQKITKLRLYESFGSPGVVIAVS